MEAGILILLFLFGGYAISTDESISKQEKEVQIVKQQDKTIEDKDLDYKIEDYSNQRFFKNIYQLEIKQYHFEGNIRVTDSYSTMSISSADLMKIKDEYVDYDDKNLPYNVLFNFTTQLIPNDVESEFDMKYRINYKEDYSANNKNKSIFEIDIQNKIDMYVDKRVLIEHKNYQYEIYLRKNSESKYFKNAEIMDCSGDFTCEILKENTIAFKKGLEGSQTKKQSVVKEVLSNNTKEDPKDVKVEKIIINKKQVSKNQLKTFDNYVIHKVKKGEYLSKIANDYGVPIVLIKKLNNLTDPNLNVGTELLIANKTTKIHKISSGENLYQISIRYNKTMESLLKLNNLDNPNKIYEGYGLILSL